ncbi:hypothetical protein LOD99_16173 [Oopsacas minuta]|uniref:Uncharacterized protein n=1 Tax=Oopsacas minuta TaxID=111878 RepID=A0AAV7K7F2_9METZ|nr:hypothetical protein LOD99_16173 [Oopsacas minuta]
MENEDIKQLEIKLSNAVSYEERSAIRTRLRVLRKEMNSARSVISSLPIQSRTDIESTQRPKSAILTNGHGSNAHAPVENGHSRKSLAEKTPPSSHVRSSKFTNFSKDFNPLDNSSAVKSIGDINKRHSYQPTSTGHDKITTSQTPPFKRKETKDTCETRGRSRTIDTVMSSDIGPEAITIQTLTKQQIQFCLTEYVNRELKPNRKIVPTGESLYLVCADPRILCRLVNVSKKNTIDMRCLTEISDTASDTQIKIAVEENMTLAVESARSIGCHITEDDVLKIIHHDQDIIHKILLRILRARVIDFGGMGDMPSSYFGEPSFIFEQLNLNIPTDSNETVPPPTDATQFVSGKLSSNNDKKSPEAKKSEESRNTDIGGIKIRRVCSDVLPDVIERPQISKAQQSSDFRGLTASFEKNRVEQISRQMSGDSPKKLDSVQIETKNTPTSLRRHHKDVIFTRSSELLSRESASLVEEHNISRTQTPPLANSDASSEITKPPSRFPKKHTSPQVQASTAYRSPRTAKKTESKEDKPDSVFVTNPENKSTQQNESAVTELSKADTITSPEPVIQNPTPTPSLPQNHVPQESPPPPSKLTMDLSKQVADSPADSPLNSTDSTPVASIDNAKDSDEYLLTLQDNDPSLTYEQRKRIRQLKRMLKQNLPKK